jgi:hypothetical protein
MEQTPAPIHPELLADIERFCATHGMSVTRFGTRALGDPRFVHDLRLGRECRRRTIDAVRRFLASGTDESDAPPPEAALS